jgi:hypothetical protein
MQLSKFMPKLRGRGSNRFYHFGQPFLRQYGLAGSGLRFVETRQGCSIWEHDATPKTQKRLELRIKRVLIANMHACPYAHRPIPLPWSFSKFITRLLRFARKDTQRALVIARRRTRHGNHFKIDLLRKPSFYSLHFRELR